MNPFRTAPAKVASAGGKTWTVTVASCVILFVWSVLAHGQPASPDPPTRIDRALKLAATTFHVNYWLLRNRAWCESRYRPSAVNSSSGAGGLFQWLKSSWETTPYRRFSRFDPYASALAAGWAESRGRGNEWICRG